MELKSKAVTKMSAALPIRMTSAIVRAFVTFGADLRQQGKRSKVSTFTCCKVRHGIVNKWQLNYASRNHTHPVEGIQSNAFKAFVVSEVSRSMERATGAYYLIVTLILTLM